MGFIAPVRARPVALPGRRPAGLSRVLSVALAGALVGVWSVARPGARPVALVGGLPGGWPGVLSVALGGTLAGVLLGGWAGVLPVALAGTLAGGRPVARPGARPVALAGILPLLLAVLARVGSVALARSIRSWRSLAWLRESCPAVTVEEQLRVVEDGHILTSAGISAGIDLALKVVARYYGEAVARLTARHMEYRLAADDSVGLNHA